MRGGLEYRMDTPLIISPSLGSALLSQGLRTGDNQGSSLWTLHAYTSAEMRGGSHNTLSLRYSSVCV